MNKNKTREGKYNIICVHNSLMGCSARIARSFNYPTTHIKNYYDGEDNRILLFARQPYLTESILSEFEFIHTYYEKIIGVVITDDKCNGPYFGEKAHIFSSLGIPIIAIIDRVMTTENKVEIERWLNKYAR